MLRDDQELTEDLSKAVITRFQEYLIRTKTSAEKAARSMGMAPSTLSQVVNGNYAGDNELYVRKVDKWVEQRLAKETAPKDPGFVKTQVASQILGVAKWADKMNGIVLIHGPSGIGKTRTLQAIRAEFPGSIYISITRAGQSTRAVLDMIVAELRMSGRFGSSRELEQQIWNSLAGSDRMILVDEVHRLAGRRNDEALHTLRDLHDHTGCPIVLAGMSQIATYIDTGKNQYDNLEQIDSRICFRLDLTEAAMSFNDGGDGLFTVADIERFLASQKLRVAGDVAGYLHGLANEPRMGGLRTVLNLIKLVREVAGDRVVTRDMVRKIFADSRGLRFVETYEQLAETRRRSVG